MFTSDMAESRQNTVVLQGLDEGVFGDILSYIYSGTLHVSLDKVQPLYQAADLLQLDYLRDTCSSYMAMNVERSHYMDLYKFADVFSVNVVRKACLQLIRRNFVEVASSEEFYSLSINQLTEVISHDELDVKEEITVWEAVVRWVQYNREDRLHHLPSIFPHIRFNLLTSENIAAILEHPLVKEVPGSSEVIRNVIQKWKPYLKPRLGMTTEMVMLSNTDSKELLFMNPLEGRYISCSYKPEDFPCITDVTVTRDNNIYILTRKGKSNDELSVLKYNYAGNVWEHAGMSSVSKSLRLDNDSTWYDEHLVEVDGSLYYLAADVEDDSGLVWMRKYNWHTDQWQECAQLQLDNTEYDYSEALACSSHLYFLTSLEMHCYDPSQDCWCKRSPASDPDLDIYSAVTMGTELFCADFDFKQIMVYDTESDRWQKLQGWPNKGNRKMKMCISPCLFVMDNRLHIWLSCVNDEDDKEELLVYVYDRSADVWRDLNATLPNKTYFSPGPMCPVARMYLPYLKGAQKHITSYAYKR
ncbi:kelch repeat and BTB domain-containing protein 8-like [Branchiostoma floridae]|uniref:Kelch repeat and BTB domain-containing protein 8-like n=1 Tax=Branchiostoma floridae TaxID=7739 RepID=A0A9J7K797_BRAFL|nr:kelch repeat and BTB domain-containing protein 8-like [Branchiostoma floridae]